MEFKLITPKTISGTYFKTNLSRFGLAGFLLAAILDTLEQSRDHLGTVLGLFWDNFVTIFGPFWDHKVTILGLFWDYFVTILGPFWDYSGTILGPFRDYFQTIL